METFEKQKEVIVGQGQPVEVQRSADALHRVYGEQHPLPFSMNQKEMTQKLDELRGDAVYSDFSELLTFNELLHRKNSLQREAELSSKGVIDREELEVANQAETYFTYLKSIISHTLKTTDDYLVLRRSLPSIPSDILREERDLEVFNQELAQAMQMRTDFANASLVTYLLSVQRDRKGNVMQDQRTLTTQLELLKKRMDAAGKAALSQQDRTAIRIHANALDQKIIELLAAKGHLSANLLLRLQTERYRVVLEQQKAVIRDGGLAKERSEWEALRNKNKKAKNGQGEPLTEEEGKCFSELKELLRDAKPNYMKLSDERHALSDDMVHTAIDLAKFHQDTLELMILQGQFKTQDDLRGATPSNPDDTPPIVKATMSEVTEQRGAFHRERLAAFATRFEEEVLSEGIPEKVEDFSNKTGRDFVRKISNRLTSLVTWPAPEALGIRDALNQRLSGPLNDAMGWPVDKMDMTFDELTDSERAEVLRRSISVAEAIRSFDRTKIRDVQSSLAVIKALPPAKTALGEAPLDPLPDLAVGDLTTENMDDLINKYGLPTVYVLAIRQMNDAIGDSDKGFIGEVQNFTDSINDVIDVHLDVADALFKQANDWRTLMYALLAVALGAGVAGHFIPKLIRGGTRMVRGGIKTGANATKVGSRVAAGEATQTAGTSGRITEELTKMRYVQKERQLSQWLEKSTTGRWVSNLKFIRNSRIAGVAGKTIKYGSFALIPAISAYEFHETYHRVKEAQGNVELQKEYASNYKTTALETAGLTVTLPLALGPQIVLTAPVLYASQFSRSRSEVKAGWERTATDWAREFDSTGLMLQLKNTTLANAVESGGGGALKSRITFPNQKDQQEAIETIQDAQVVARRNITEAYFMRNLLLPQGADDALAQRLLKWKLVYVGMATHGGYEFSNASVYKEADMYAEMMLRKAEMEERKEDMFIEYSTEAGHDGKIDFSKLVPGSATVSEIRSQVAAYTLHVRPIEELVFFNALGQLARDRKLPNDRESELEKAKNVVYRTIIAKLAPTILKFDAFIEETDWPGVDVPLVTSGDTSSKNTVRWYLHHKIKEQVDLMVDKALEGDLSFQDYEKALSKSESLMQSVKMRVDDGTTNELYQEAGKFFGRNLADAEKATVNPLARLVYGMEGE